jgi:hypothetical protein
LGKAFIAKKMYGNIGFADAEQGEKANDGNFAYNDIRIGFPYIFMSEEPSQKCNDNGDCRNIKANAECFTLRM